MDWIVVAPFDVRESRNWLTPFVPGDDHTFQFVLRPPGLARNVGGSTMSAAGWWHMLRYARRAWPSSGAGLITVFPQLAAAGGLLGRVFGPDVPIVAWCFNMGRLYGGIRGAAARVALRHVRRFVVHSSGEIPRYSEWLDVPPDRFEFVHLQRPRRRVEVEEDREAPFVLSMGSANRDYRTFFDAVGRLGMPAVVVAAPYCACAG